MEKDRNGISKIITRHGQEIAGGTGTAMSTLMVHTLKAQQSKDREAGQKEAVGAHNTIAQAEKSTGWTKGNPPDAAPPHQTKKRRTSSKDWYVKKNMMMLTKLQWAQKNPLDKQALDEHHHHP